MSPHATRSSIFAAVMSGKLAQLRVRHRWWVKTVLPMLKRGRGLRWMYDR